MRKRRLITLVILAAGSAAVAGTVTGRWMFSRAGTPVTPSSTKRDSQVVVVNPNFGEVWESEAALVRVRLANTTDKPLHLARIGGNCNCTRVTPESATIEPRGELEVTLVIDLTDRVPMDFGKLTRSFEVVLSVVIADKLPKQFLLTGTCRSHVATSTTVLHFGESNVRGTPAVSRWLTVTTDRDTAAIRVIANDLALQVGAFERHGNVWRVPLIPDHAQIRGRFDTTVRVDALNNTGEVIGICHVVVDGVVREPAELLWEGAHAP